MYAVRALLRTRPCSAHPGRGRLHLGAAAGQADHVAIGLDGKAVELTRIETLSDWPAFEALLAHPGPWLGAFDFPGLGRSAKRSSTWAGHRTGPNWCATVKRWARALFAAHWTPIARPGPSASATHTAVPTCRRARIARAHQEPTRGNDVPQGAPRLLSAGVSLPGMHAADPQRLAVEAYPGLIARSITPDSYKSDDKRKQTSARQDARRCIIDAVCTGHTPQGFSLRLDDFHRARLIDDASGDCLRCRALALLQAAACAHAGPPHFGLPADIDFLEGWIAGA